MKDPYPTTAQEKALCKILANTEIMVIYETADEDIYVNGVLNFQGTKAEAQVFAGTHNFGGGVEIASWVGGRYVRQKI